MSGEIEHKINDGVGNVVLIMALIGAVLLVLVIHTVVPGTFLEDNPTEFFENEICIYEVKQKIKVNNCVVLDETETTLFRTNYLDKRLGSNLHGSYGDVGVECVLGIIYPNNTDFNKYNILVFDNQDYVETNFKCSSVSQEQLDWFKSPDEGIGRVCVFVFDKNKEKQTVFFVGENHDEEKCFNSESEIFEYALK